VTEPFTVRIAFAALAALLSLAVQAAPTAPVSFDRSLWPEQLNSPALFDVASRAEILSFARVLHESELLDDATLAARLGLRQINLPNAAASRMRRSATPLSPWRIYVPRRRRSPPMSARSMPGG